MKIIKTLLHYWFALISILSFVIGWGMLAHSLKPIQPAQNTSAGSNNISLPALPPIQAYGSGGGSGLNFAAPSNPSSNQTTTVRPRLRSGGS